ncbi:glycosyltransferase family 4 protein [Chlorobium phaeovibrioides]|uniref:Glycosyltransferase family 4 protein n=2 Tax=Chlorobium phaeovibrioides TaxID=1094 RepID=A0A5M8IGC7_CHLPH|nr:glycosyltransferase family 4 protein [Chlorobium phaeovibrioides]
MNVLALTRYTRLGASSRLRFYQYTSLLEASDISVTGSPLFRDAYVAGLQGGRKSIVGVVDAYWRRLQLMMRHKRFDLLWIEKECLPWLPAGIEQWLLSDDVPYVLDYDDAVYHSYDQHSRAIVRYVLADKHPQLMRRAAMVLAGNSYLAEFAQQAGARRVELLPTVIDLDRYSTKVLGSAIPSNDVPSIGWIGQRSTAEYLRFLAPLFQRMVDEKKARFSAIGIDTFSLGLPMRSIPWSEETEVASISTLDIGIMPLPDGPFERGKCGYKLIQYMACGLPVVASPVGVNREIVEHGVNGFLAETLEEWELALTALLADPELRKRMGKAGRKKVEQKYCIPATLPKLKQWMYEVAGND